MKKIWKKSIHKIVSCVLTLAVVGSLLPMSVFAAEPVDYQQLYTKKDVEGGVQITGIDETYFATLSDADKASLSIKIPATIDSKNVVSIYSGTDGRSTIGTINATTDITSIDMSDAIYLTNLGNYAFWKSNAETIVFPDSTSYTGGTLSIGKMAFNENTNVTALTIPSYVRFSNEASYDASGSGSVFKACTSLETVVFEDDTAPTTGVALPYGTFQDCTKLISVILPTHLEGISRYGFRDCIALEGIHFADTCNAPGGAVTIGSFAFDGGAYETVTIPIYVKSIKERAFGYSTTKLKTVYLEADIDNMRDFSTSSGGYAFASDWIANSAPIIVTKTAYDVIKSVGSDWTGADLYNNATYVCEVAYLNDDDSVNTTETKLFNRAFSYVKDGTDANNDNVDIWVSDADYAFPNPGVGAAGWTYTKNEMAALDKGDAVTETTVYPAIAATDKYIWFGDYPQTSIDTIYGIPSESSDDKILFMTSNTGEGHYGVFQYAPIKWIIFDRTVNSDGTTTYNLLADKMLITRAYQDTAGDSVSWENSPLRAWLNGESASDTDFSQAPGFENEPFYASAFDDAEKAMFEKTNVISHPSYELTQYDLQDNVYLLAYTNEEYGKLDDADTMPEFSGYAAQTHILMGPQWPYWWLRTSYQTKQLSISYNTGNYAMFDTDDLTNTTIGVRPAITITVPVGYTLDNDGSDATPYEIVPQVYDVDFEVDGQAYGGTQTVTYNTCATEPTPTPEKAGYTFGGWYTEDTYTTKWDFANDVVTEDMTLYAQWTPITYTIDYALDGGTNSTNNPYEFTADTTTITLEDATREGFTFVDWVNDATNLAVTEIPRGTIGNLSLTATWSPNSGTAYTVIHETEDLAGGTYTEQARNTLYGTTGTSVTPNRNTYTGFTAPSAQTANILPDGSLVITYRYTRDSYTVTFDTDGGVPAPADQSVKYQGTIAKPTEEMTKSGYTFSFWSADGTTEYDFTTTIAAGVTLKAVWTQNSSGGGTSYYTSILAPTTNGSAELSSTRNRLNATVTVTTNPDDGYVVDSVVVTYGNGRTVSVTDSGRGTYTYKQPGATATVTVTFVTEEETDTDASLNRDDHMAYMKGYTDGTFGPNRNITRAEATVMFSRLLTNEIPTYLTATVFDDMTGDEWYADAVTVMTHYGIITGYTDGTFGGDKPITRAEFAAISSRFDDLAETDVNIFSDVPDDYWAMSYINSAVAKGWINGYTDGTFKPERNISRAEAVTLVNRVLDRSGDLDFIRDNLEDMLIFADVNDSYWAYEAILEAANSHDYYKANGKEIWTSLD